jgi:hypothetical protein
MCTKLQSSERMQPTACPELVEGAQAVGKRQNDKALLGKENPSNFSFIISTLWNSEN